MIKNLRSHIFIVFKKFINLDEFVMRLAKIPRVNVNALFDSCRELKTKGTGTIKA